MNNLSVFNEGLINVYRIGNEQYVDARELHEGLKSKQDFSTWVKKRLIECDAIENQDYFSSHKKMERQVGATTRIDYSLKLDIAKEMAMLERNEIGKKYRRYFIHVEKMFKNWLSQRSNGKAIRLIVTDTIRDYIPESPNKKFKYKHFTDLVYKVVFGKTAKQLREELGLPYDANIRDNVKVKELEQIEEVENEISVLISMGFNYDRVKELVIQKHITNEILISS